MLITGSSTLKISSFPQNNSVDTFNIKENGWVQSLSFSRDKMFVAYVQKDSLPEILSLKDGRMVKSVHVIRDLDNVRYAVFSHKRNKIMALGTSSGIVVIYDTETQSIAEIYDVATPVLSLDFTCMDTLLIVACEDGKLVMLDMGVMKRRQQVRYLGFHIERLRAHPTSDHNFGICTMDGSFQLFNTHNFAPKWSIVITRHSRLNDFAFSPLPDSTDLVIVDGEFRMVILNWKTGQWKYRCSMRNEVTAIAYADDGENFAVGLIDGTVMVFQTKDPRTPKYELKMDTERIRCMQFSCTSSDDFIAKKDYNKSTSSSGDTNSTYQPNQVLNATFDDIQGDLKQRVMELNSNLLMLICNFKEFICKELAKIGAQNEENLDIINIISNSDKVRKEDRACLL